MFFHCPLLYSLLLLGSVLSGAVYQTVADRFLYLFSDRIEIFVIVLGVFLFRLLYTHITAPLKGPLSGFLSREQIILIRTLLLPLIITFGIIFVSQSFHCLKKQKHFFRCRSKSFDLFHIFQAFCRRPNSTRERGFCSGAYFMDLFVGAGL